jgi:hypothetical protein
MTGADHRTILAIGYAVIAAIIGFTYVLLMLISLGVFITLGITSTKETGDATQAGIGLLGGAFAVIFYCLLAVIFVLPPLLASWKVWKGRPRARMWGLIAALLLLPVFPLGTALGVYGLWFWLTPAGRNFRLENPSNSVAR